MQILGAGQPLDRRGALRSIFGIGVGVGALTAFPTSLAPAEAKLQNLVYNVPPSSGFVDRDIIEWVSDNLRHGRSPAIFEKYMPITKPTLLVIDPGHGTLHKGLPFIEAGAKSTDEKYTEAQIVMRLSQAIAAEASQRGYLVALTHSRDAEKMRSRTTIEQVYGPDDQPFPVIAEKHMVLRARSDFAEHLAAATRASSVVLSSIHIDYDGALIPQPRLFTSTGDTAAARMAQDIALNFNPRPRRTTTETANFAVLKHMAADDEYIGRHPETGALINHTGIDVSRFGVDQSIAMLMESGSWAYPDEVLKLWKDPVPFAKQFVDAFAMAHPLPALDLQITSNINHPSQQQVAGMVSGLRPVQR